MDHLAVKAGAGLARQHDKLPRFQRAMVGNTDAGCQDLFKMVRIDLAGLHGLGGDRPSCAEKFDDTAHEGLHCPALWRASIGNFRPACKRRMWRTAMNR